VIIWENVGEIWTEKVRLGVVGGQIPGGFCARFNEAFVAVSGFHGAIQIWSWAAEMVIWKEHLETPFAFACTHPPFSKFMIS